MPFASSKQLQKHVMVCTGAPVLRTRTARYDNLPMAQSAAGKGLDASDRDRALGMIELRNADTTDDATCRPRIPGGSIRTMHQAGAATQVMRMRRTPVVSRKRTTSAAWRVPAQRQPEDDHDHDDDLNKLNALSHLVVTDGDVEEACGEFFQWLGEPPITPFEINIKQRRASSESQQKPIRSSMKFLFTLLLQKGSIQKNVVQYASTSSPAAAADRSTSDAVAPVSTPASASRSDHDSGLENQSATDRTLAASREIDSLGLSIFVKLEHCKTIYLCLVERATGAERIFQLFLLIKKVLVFLSSMQSLKSKSLTAPITFSSYVYVDALCREATGKRKQRAQNRKFGIMFQPPLQAAAASAMSSVVPMNSNSNSGLQMGQAIVDSPGQQLTIGRKHENHNFGVLAAAGPGAWAAGSDSGVLTIAELKTLSVALRSRMEAAVAQAQSTVRDTIALPSRAREHAKMYTRCLLVLTLVLGLAPRSQVLKALQLGTTFVYTVDAEGGAGSYCICMPAELSKSSKPTVIPLHSSLTPLYDHYFAVIRPILRGLQASAGSSSAVVRSTSANANPNTPSTAPGPTEDSKYVFLKDDGTGPRAEFSSWTRAVTTEVLGKAYNAHTFRHAVITTLYQAGSTQAEMDQLAILMQHDVSVARNVYFRPQMMIAAQQTASKLAGLVMDSVS